MAEQAITSLAILKVNWDSGRDYIGNFVPFVAECLRQAAQPELTSQDIQAALVEKFGLTIPQAALHTILKRASRYGFVQKERGIYRRDEDALSKLEFTKVRSDVLRQHEALIGKLVLFCNDNYSLSWSDEEAETALLSYIKKSSTPLLAAAVKGQPIAPPQKSVKHADFVISAFILSLQARDPEGFRYLETIVKGSVLANVLLFPDLGRAKAKFEKIEVYFDTPFLLRALGLAGPQRQAPCRELLDLLYQENADLRCFKHTFHEIWRILDAAAYALRTPLRRRAGYYETMEYFLQSGYSPSDVELVLARLDQSLRNIRIQIRERPPHEERHTVDERGLESMLREQVRYHSQEALLHDLDSLTAIYRLRRGQLCQRMESCRAIFVTTNVNLVKAGTRYFTQEYDRGGPLVPLAMLGDLFGTLVWLKRPMAAPELPLKIVIAECYAALNPSDSLWKRYLSQIDRLETQGDVTEEDYYLLRFSSEARMALMNMTLGDPDWFSDTTVEDILAKTKAALTAEATQRLQAEQERRKEAESRMEEVEAKSRERELAHRQLIERVSAKIGLWCSRAVFWVGTMLLLALSGLIILPAALASFTPDVRNTITAILLLLMGLFTFLNWWRGTTLRSITRTVEVRVANFTQNKLTDIFTK